MEIIKNYHDDLVLRRSFNELAETTFGLNFENWYQNGFWGDNYIPYSVVENGRVVANVSVNRTDLLIDGRLQKVYQLGTVMTAEDYRNRGYSRAIMEKIEEDLKDADGVYLFANDSVLEFYPKFSFRQGTEYIFSKTVRQEGPCRMEKVAMDGPEGWGRLQKVMETNRFHGACDMLGNSGLIFFYVSQFMKDCVYYDKELDAHVIAELEDGVLLLHNIFSTRDITLEDILQAFGAEVTQVSLGFTPADASGFQCQRLQEEDCTFFVKGNVFQDFADKRLRIPSLSHA